MTDSISITGLVATEPNHSVTAAELHVTSFRLVSTQRRFDRDRQQWVDGESNWYTVTAFRHLARNVPASVRKGQRVLVTGRLRLRSWEKDGRHGMTVEVEAEAIGHDLAWGTAEYTRALGSARREPQAASTEEAGPAAEAPAWPTSALGAEEPVPF